MVPVRQFLSFIGLDPDRFASSTFVSSLLILNASFASSAPSGVALPIAVEFGLSQIETTLAISLFIGEPLRSLIRPSTALALTYRQQRVTVLVRLHGVHCLSNMVVAQCS